MIIEVILFWNKALELTVKKQETLIELKDKKIQSLIQKKTWIFYKNYVAIQIFYKINLK